MKNNKIFKLIFSLIIVSLSIIGASYLFFLSKNKVVVKNDNSGNLYVKYNELFTITNIMPDWTNDGKTYIDVNNILASKLNPGESFDSLDFNNFHPNYYGVMEPFKIEIENKEDKKNNFKISIDNIKTNMIDQDSEAYDINNNNLGYTKNNSDNLIITIYKDKINEESIIYTNKIKNDSVLETNNLSLNKGKTIYYILIMYKKADYNQMDGLNINLSGKINLYGANNTKIIYIN